MLGVVELTGYPRSAEDARTRLGQLFQGAGILGWVVFGVWGIILIGEILLRIGGVLALIVGYVFFVLTIPVAPWYAYLEWGNMEPLLVVYGGTVVPMILFGIGLVIRGYGTEDTEEDSVETGNAV